MGSYGWALIWLTDVLIKRGNLGLDTHTQRRTCEDTQRRQLRKVTSEETNSINKALNTHFLMNQFNSVAQSRPTLCDPHALQHARLPCPSPIPGAYSNSCPSCEWCHPTIASSVVPFPSHFQSFPTSGSFPMSQFFASGGWSIWVSASASVLSMNIQDWFPLEWIGWISLQSKRLSSQFKSINSLEFSFFL